MQPVTVILIKGKRQYKVTYLPDQATMVFDKKHGREPLLLTSREAIQFVSRSFEDLLNGIPLPETKGTP